MLEWLSGLHPALGSLEFREPVFLLTMLPPPAAKAATELLTVPTLGIGSGPSTNGQMLVAAEMLGFCNSMGHRRYSKQYANFEQLGRSALQAFVQETRSDKFPTGQHITPLDRFNSEQFLNHLELAIGGKER